MVPFTSNRAVQTVLFIVCYEVVVINKDLIGSPSNYANIWSAKTFFSIAKFQFFFWKGRF